MPLRKTNQRYRTPCRLTNHRVLRGYFADCSTQRLLDCVVMRFGVVVVSYKGVQPCSLCGRTSHLRHYYFTQVTMRSTPHVMGVLQSTCPFHFWIGFSYLPDLRARLRRGVLHSSPSLPCRGPHQRGYSPTYDRQTSLPASHRGARQLSCGQTKVEYAGVDKIHPRAEERVFSFSTQ